jgi:hypothetical protein
LLLQGARRLGPRGFSVAWAEACFCHAVERYISVRSQASRRSRATRAVTNVAAPSVALVEELEAPRPEQVEAVGAEIGLGEVGKPLRVERLSVLGVPAAALVRRVEELDAAVGLASLPRVVDGDRGRVVCAEVARSAFASRPVATTRRVRATTKRSSR